MDHFTAVRIISISISLDACDNQVVIPVTSSQEGSVTTKRGPTVISTLSNAGVDHICWIRTTYTYIPLIHVRILHLHLLHYLIDNCIAYVRYLECICTVFEEMRAVR
jgi:hypothetical protein